MIAFHLRVKKWSGASTGHQPPGGRGRVAGVTVRLFGVALLWALGRTVPCLAEIPVTPEKGDASRFIWLENIKSAQQAVKQKNRPQLIFFTAEYCGWCKLMKQRVLADPAAQEKLADFACVQIDTVKQPRTAMAFGVGAIPRAMIVNLHGQMVADQVGYQPLPEFLAWLDEAAPRLAQSVPEAPRLPTIEGDDREAVPMPPAPLAAINVEGDILSPNMLRGISSSDLRERQAYQAAVREAGRPCIPSLLALLDHQYLGFRIAAAELLPQITGDEAPIDPWLGPEELRRQRQSWSDRHPTAEGPDEPQ